MPTDLNTPSELEEYDPELVEVLEKNIRTIIEIQERAREKRTFEQRISDTIAEKAGHLSFLYIHIAVIAIYVLINSGWLGIKPFDPYPFGLLIGIITVEVLFLSTFILISQNRDREDANRREDLDLQMSLLNQYELSHVLRMLDAIEDKIGIPNEEDVELRKMEERISPTDVLIEMDLVRKRARCKK